MDAIRFDALTKAWTAESSRRWTLAGLLAGAIGGFGLMNADDVAAAKSGKCKQKCGQCQFCKKGKCRKKDGKKRCKKGKCKSLANETPCSGGDGDCVCFRAIEGDGFCATFVVALCTEGACANSGECGAGHRCVPCSSPGTTTCLPECGVE